MATLHVRRFPNTLYRRLVKKAERERRSLSAEVAVLLRRELTNPLQGQKEILRELDHRRFRPTRSIASSLSLLKADRRR